MAGAEIGPNEIIIHLVNPYKCLDCGTEFFHKNSFLHHLAEHMDKLKTQHPCYQMVCGVNLAAQQPNSITVTKDILQINENQMFELQDTSVDLSKLPPLKTLEQAGILHLPTPEKVIPTVIPKLRHNPPLGISLVPQHILQQGIRHQNVAVIHGQSNIGSMSNLGKPPRLEKQDLSSLQTLHPAETTSEELHKLVQQALMETGGVKEEIGAEASTSCSAVVQGDSGSSGQFSVVPKIDFTRRPPEPWLDVNGQPSVGMKHVMVYKEMPNVFANVGDKRVECKICFNRFANKNVLMRHQMVHSGEKPHSCYRCFKQFNDISSLAKHVKIHKRCHQCPVCLKMFLRRKQMEFHLGQHKKKRFIQFGHKYHEVQVSTSRNTDGHVVHEFSLAALLKNANSQEESRKDTTLDGVSSLNSKAKEESMDVVKNITTSTSTVVKETVSETQHNVVYQPEIILSENPSTQSSHFSENEKINEFENNIQAVNKQIENPGSHKIIYSCGHCKKLINTRPTLSRHLMMHTNEKPFKCEQCGKQFRHKNDLFHHYKTHSKPVKCNTCGSAFSKELYLQNHLKKGCPFLESDNDKFAVLPDLTYQCNLCSKILKTKANVVRHLRIHAFNNRESDSKKISKNINRTDEASKGYISGSDMSSNNAEDHIKPLEHSVGFECTLCGEQFRFKSFIIIHVRMHLGQRSFKCKHCNKGFYGRYMLRKHEQNHTRPYKCPKCGQGFNRRYLMAHHFNKSHNEEAEDKMKDISFLPEDKLLSCDICGKTMKSYQKSLMQYHIRLHKDVRPHQCKVCQKTFISDIALKKHSFNHSKPYTCQVCDKGFSRRYLMLGHFEKRCKHKLKKQENLVGVEQKEVTIVVREEAGENQATILKSEDETSTKASFVPFQAETVTEVDEAKGIQVFRCAPCDKTFTARDALSRHIKTFMKSTACRYCKTSFEDKHLTLAHQRCCLGEVDVGGKVKTHHKMVQALGEKQEKVLKTMKEMNSKIDCLTAAAVTHSTDSSHGQDTDTSPMDEGVGVVADPSTDDIKAAVNPATQQSTNTNTKAVLKRTMSALSSAYQYQCPECVKSFTTARGLKIHAASHVRLYKCETCGQDFTQVGRFRLHLKSHEAGGDGSGSDNILDLDMTEDSDQPINKNQTNQMRDMLSKKSKSVSGNVEMDEGQLVLSNTNTNEIDNHSQNIDKNTKGDEENGEEEEDTAGETTGSGKTESAVSLRLMQTGTRGRPFSCQMCRRRFTEETGLQQHLSQTHGVK